VAHPFFSGEVQQSPESGGGLEDYEIYHKFLQVYPGYTIESIESDLSWRQVKLLLSCWEEDPPMVLRIEKVESMLEQKFGFKTISKTKLLGGDDLVNHLKGQGLL